LKRKRGEFLVRKLGWLNCHYDVWSATTSFHNKLTYKDLQIRLVADHAGRKQVGHILVQNCQKIATSHGPLLAMTYGE